MGTSEGLCNATSLACRAGLAQKHSAKPAFYITEPQEIAAWPSREVWGTPARGSLNLLILERQWPAQPQWAWTGELLSLPSASGSEACPTWRKTAGYVGFSGLFPFPWHIHHRDKACAS